MKSVNKTLLTRFSENKKKPNPPAATNNHISMRVSTPPGESAEYSAATAAATQKEVTSSMPHILALFSNFQLHLSLPL